MRIITISREFGSGGRELGKRLADVLGYDYYDKEIIMAISKQNNLDTEYIETTMNVPLTFSKSFYMNTMKTNLMVEEKKIIEKIAEKGKDFVIVGRNADILLQDYQPFNLFVCANLESKLQRCMERASKEENLTRKEYEHKMKQIDQSRRKSRQIITGKEWGNPSSYHMVINTSGWNLKELAFAVSEFANHYFK